MIAPQLAESPEVAAILEWDADAVVDGKLDRDQLKLVVAPRRLEALCAFLKARRGYDFLSDITAVDWYPAEPRFEVVYHLRCYERKQLLRLKCRLNSDCAEIASVRPVWRAADWYEREVFDLFGIRFTGHPDLRRILMPEEWEGHPLRKDYPVTGHR